MKIQKINLIDFLEDFKTRYSFSTNFIECLLFNSTKLKFSTPTSFRAMNFGSTQDQDADEYLTVAQMAERYPAFSQGSLRWLIFNGETNGFNKVVRKIGKKVILSLQDFKKFIEKKL